MDFARELESLKKQNEQLTLRVKKLEGMITGSGTVSLNKVAFAIDKSGNYSDLYNKVILLEKRVGILESA